jgi:hypothetical protein
MIVKLTRHYVQEAVQEGEMDEIWKAIRKDLDCDITVEYVGGPVQIRFGDYISGAFKRVPLTKVITELISGIHDDDGYHREIANALIKQGKRVLRALRAVEQKK